MGEIPVIKQKMLIDFDTCSGCQSCVIACSMAKAGIFSPSRSLITMHKLEGRCLSIPIICEHCGDPQCLHACPSGAVTKDPETGVMSVSEDLLDIMEVVTRRTPRVVPIALQDITPYGNDVYHVNSIMQPWIATDAPVVGVAITAEVPVPGCGTGASHCVDIELASRFCIEVAKAYGARKRCFYDRAEFQRLVELYGSMSHLRRLSKDS